MIPQGVSKYSKRLSFRRSVDGGKENPMPRPFHLDYLKGTLGSFSNSWWAVPFKEWVPPAQKLKVVINKKQTYSHFDMNYAGWNR